MIRPWMPLYVGDYIADTRHLSGAEHGAYLLLMMHYWMNSKLPDDDRQLARIAAMTPKEWKKSKPTIQEFFSDGWKHKRIEFEITEAARISAAGKVGGIASAQARRERSANDKAAIVERPLNDHTDDQATIRQALHSPSQRKEDAANAAPVDQEADLFRRGREVLGQSAGGLVKNLLKAKSGNPALARAALEYASTRNDAREYIGGIIRGKDPPDIFNVDPRL